MYKSTYILLYDVNRLAIATDNKFQNVAICIYIYTQLISLLQMLMAYNKSIAIQHVLLYTLVTALLVTPTVHKLVCT